MNNDLYQDRENYNKGYMPEQEVQSYSNKNKNPIKITLELLPEAVEHIENITETKIEFWLANLVNTYRGQTLLEALRYEERYGA